MSGVHVSIRASTVSDEDVQKDPVVASVSISQIKHIGSEKLMRDGKAQDVQVLPGQYCARSSRR